jgi:hypothetical protein
MSSHHYCQKNLISIILKCRRTVQKAMSSS